jgi:YebC/PmpR family DNA-binding regulatory protein
MAGHSKWANTRHRKAAQDAKRSKIFTKLIREITVAARTGGGVIEDNPRLRLVVDKALTANMSRDVIERAIKRGVGGDDGAHLEELTYEGYGVGGVAVLVNVTTDNRNRSASDVRHAFAKCGGHLGTDGSVSYLFSKRGEIFLEAGISEDQVMDLALEAGANDILIQADGSIEIITPWEILGKVRTALEQAGIAVAHADINMAPSLHVEMNQETATQNLKLIDMLEDLDDVQAVFTNANFTAELMEAIGGG